MCKCGQVALVQPDAQFEEIQKHLTPDGLQAPARVSSRRGSLERKSGKRSEVRQGWGPSELPPQKAQRRHKIQPSSLSSIAEEEGCSRASVMRAVKKSMEGGQRMTLEKFQRMLDDEIIEAAAREYRCEQQKERTPSKGHKKIQDLASNETKSRSFKGVWPFKLPQLLTSKKVTPAMPDMS